MGGALELRMEHFLVVSISVIVVLLILVIAVTLLLVHVCRRRFAQKEAEQRQKRTAKDLLQIRTTSTIGGGAGGVSCHMPKNIQMGTSKLPGTYIGGCSNTVVSTLGRSHQQFVVVPPDLITEAALVTPDSSCISMETVSTPCHSSSGGSYHHLQQQHNTTASSSSPSTSDHSDISSIMKDYGNLDRGQPIIGEYRPLQSHISGGEADRGGNGVLRGSRGGGGGRRRPSDEITNAGRHSRRPVQQEPQKPSRIFSLLVSQDTYPTLPPPPPPTVAVDDPQLLPPWTSNNPYIHTSRPYRLALVKPVGPDEQYPPSSVRPQRPPNDEISRLASNDEHRRRRRRHVLEDEEAQQDSYAAMASLTDSQVDPLYESITSLRFLPQHQGVKTIAGQAELSSSTSEPPPPPLRTHESKHTGCAPDSSGEHSSTHCRVGGDVDLLSANGLNWSTSSSSSTQQQQSQPPPPGDAVDEVRTDPVITSSDSVQDILRKLSGDAGGGLRADSPDIRRELEFAFLARTEETNI
jgi:hypothetical protein